MRSSVAYRVAAFGSFLLSGLATQGSRADVTYYVATNGVYGNSGSTPSAPTTLEGARDKIRSLHNQNPTIHDNFWVVLAGGTYYRSQAFALSGVADSEADGYRITYTAQANGTGGWQDVLIHGGSPITTTWTLQGAAFGGIKWSTVLTDVEDGFQFRDLYFRNNRLTRARYPNVGDAINGFLRIAGAEYTFPGDVFWRHYRVDVLVPGLPADGLEMVVRNGFRMHRQFVNSTVYGTAATSSYFTPTNPLGEFGDYQIHAPRLCTPCAQDPFTPEAFVGWPGALCFFENALGFVDSVNEWYLSAVDGSTQSATLTVILPVGTDPNAAGNTFTYPVLNQLVDASNITNVTFNRLNFGFTSVNMPTTGYVAGQSGVSHTLGLVATGALRFKGARHCEVLGCRIGHTSGSGIEISGNPSVPNEFNIIQGNKVFDIGGTGIYLDGWNWLQATRGNIILHNKVLGFGRVFHDNCGIYVGTVSDDPTIPKTNTLFYHVGVDIQGNEVADGAYSGINLGDLNAPCPSNTTTTWPTGATCGQVTGTQGPAARYGLILGNNVHHVMQSLSDGSGIYVRGGQIPCYLQFNYVHDVLKDPMDDVPNMAAGLSWDEGAAGHYPPQYQVMAGVSAWYVDHNVIENCFESTGAPYVPTVQNRCAPVTNGWSPPGFSGGVRVLSYPVGFSALPYFVNPFDYTHINWGLNNWVDNPAPLAGPGQQQIYAPVYAYKPKDGRWFVFSTAFDGSPNCDEAKLNWYIRNARPAAVNTIIAGAGAPCGYNYAWDYVSPLIDPPSEVPCVP